MGVEGVVVVVTVEVVLGVEELVVVVVVGVVMGRRFIGLPPPDYLLGFLYHPYF